MKKCFVIQPFDNGKFDKRFDEIFKPAIEAAGDIKAYRVDQDETVEIIINSIEENIRASDIVFAEITTNNPNVWYELGYALALNKSVVMFSNSEERKDSFLFDVRHRKIVNYTIDVPSSINALKTNITNTAKAYLKKVPKINKNFESKSSDKSEITLKKIQLDCMALIYLNTDSVTKSTSSSFITSALQNNKYNPLSSKFALKTLRKLGFIELFAEDGNFNDTYEALKLTERGFTFISENMEKIILSYEDRNFDNGEYDTTDEVPF